MARPLTDRQQQVYDFIHDKICTRGYGPTVREIGEFLGIRSPNGVMCHLRALERKGMISRLANKSRAIEITNRTNGLPQAEVAPARDCLLAVRGCVARGSCSLFDSPQSFDVLELLQRTERYLLQYNGDDLRDYAIDDGDLLVVEPCTEGSGHGLELVRYASGAIELRIPATFEVTESSAEVMGVVVGVLRIHRPGAAVRPPHLLLRKAQRA
jgi:repressor LexA